MIKITLLVLIIVAIIFIIIYLMQTCREYMAKEGNNIISFIDFALTEDIAFEVLFILAIVFLIVLL